MIFKSVRFGRLFLIAALFWVYVHSPIAHAQSVGEESVFMPELEESSVIIDDDENPPEEPTYLPVKFMRLDSPIGMKDKISRIVYGITIDVPPEYDHYGYEIRRYMVNVGNPRIYTDLNFLEEQLKNVRKAKVIVNFWTDYIDQEITNLEKEMESDPTVSSSIQNGFKENKAVARRMVAVVKSWINANELFLTSVNDLQGYYELAYPEIIFVRPHERYDFYNRLSNRQRALIELRKFQSFSRMVY